MIDEKLSNFATELVSTVSKMVDEKLSVWNTKLQTIEKLPDEINQCCASFKEALTNNFPTATRTEVDFHKVLLETQNEERIQQRQRDARAKNIIIHGIPESLVNQKEHNANVVNEFINLLDCRVAPSNINRVGRQKEQGSRPIKLIMSTLNDKESVMKSLGKLKDEPENFRKISVTDDYTQEERESIREKVAKAKRMMETQGEGKYIWRVRGTLKNRLINKAVQSSKESGCKRQHRDQSCQPGLSRNSNKTSNLRSHTRKWLKFLYANADQIVNKINDLHMMIAHDKPDVILTTEVILR